MFEEIRGKLIETIGNFGIIETIIISYNYYEQLEEDDIEELESYMPEDQVCKWTIFNHGESFLSYIYRCPPKK